jgi:hypothetical protein
MQYVSLVIESEWELFNCFLLYGTFLGQDHVLAVHYNRNI